MSLRSKIQNCKTVEELRSLDSMIGEVWDAEHPNTSPTLDQLKRFALDLVE
jgi:hypothetical protein